MSSKVRYFFSVRKIQPPTPLLSTLPCGKGLTQRMGETWSFNLYTTPCLIATSAIIYNAPSDQPHLWGWDVSSYTIESPCFPSVHWDWVLYTSVSSWKLRNVDFFQLCSISPKLDLILISAHIHIAFPILWIYFPIWMCFRYSNTHCCIYTFDRDWKYFLEKALMYVGPFIFIIFFYFLILFYF